MIYGALLFRNIIIILRAFQACKENKQFNGDKGLYLKAVTLCEKTWKYLANFVKLRFYVQKQFNFRDVIHARPQHILP